MMRQLAVCLLALTLATGVFGGPVRRDAGNETSPSPACPTGWDPSPCLCREFPGGITASVYCDNATSGEEIKKVFSGLSENVGFGTFSIKDSEITSLPAEMFGKASFRMFFITHTKLAKIDDHAFNGSELTAESFLLNNNSFESFNFKSLNPLVNLRNFELSGDKLKAVPQEAFVEKDNLEVIVFNDNEISSIAGNTYSKLPKLRKIDLGRNNLTELPANAFNTSASGTPVALLLSHNQIQKVDKDAFNGAKLRLLELEDNAIESFDRETFENVLLSVSQNFGTFSTLGNPFECTKAKTSWVVELPADKKSHLIGFTCRNGKHLEEFKSSAELL